MDVEKTANEERIRRRTEGTPSFFTSYGKKMGTNRHTIPRAYAYNSCRSPKAFSCDVACCLRPLGPARPSLPSIVG